MLILHYTGMRSARGGDRPACAIRRRACPRTMWWTRTVRCCAWCRRTRRAWHAGVSYWRGHSGLNGRSIGIEIVNPGHEWGYRDFPVLQLAAVCDLSLGILARHRIPPRNVVAHSDVAPDRKEDPGEQFDWQGLARNGVGLWPAACRIWARRAVHDARACGRCGGRSRRSATGWRRRRARSGAGGGAARVPTPLAAGGGDGRSRSRHAGPAVRGRPHGGRRVNRGGWVGAIRAPAPSR